MKYVFTDFYTEFECIGGTCPDTCCARWGIVIDDATMQKYLSLEEPQRSWICSQIGEVEGKKIMKLKENGDCPFLNDCKLCDIYLKVSPDALSDTCQTYPRKIVNYYDVILATVSVSCPEAARIVLGKKEPIVFAYTENDLKVDTTGADWILYNELINGLVITTGILQNRSFAIWERVYLVLQLSYQVQKHIEKGCLENLRKNIECYNDIAYCEMRLEEMRTTVGRMPGCWKLIYSMLEGIEKAEKLPIEAQQFLVKYIVLEETDEETYRHWSERFKNVEIETEFENLAVELIFEYYMDALKGKNLFLNVLKMVLFLVLARACEVTHYNVYEQLSEKDKIAIVSKLSRVMEHSAMLDLYADELIAKNELEQLYRLAYLLY